MAIDQAKFGKLVQEQMQAIEQDPNVSGNAQIGDIVTIVEILDPGPGEPPKEGAKVELARSVRLRHSGMPHVGIGLMDEALHQVLNS